MTDLRPLIRMHQREVDERRRALANLLGALDQLTGERRAFEAQVVQEQKIASADLMSGLTYHGFAKAVIQRREQYEAAERRLQAEVAVAEEHVSEAFRELKKFEQVQEARDLAAKEARKRRETQMFDEVASIRFQRGKAE